MNIQKAVKGSKVRFTGSGGWDRDPIHASEFLTKGQVYIVERVDIYQSSSDVYLEGFGDKSFNAVMFDDVFETINGVEYDKIYDLTNDEFTRFVMNEIESITRFRELERVVISIDDFDCDPEECDEIDEPTIVVDVKVRGALWTFWFDTDKKKFDYSILNDRQVNRYIDIKEGRTPELPGLYTYQPDE
jgi:hypothetical protein